MNRRTLLAAAAASLVVPPTAAAQQGARVPRIGVLWHPPATFESFRQGLRDLGYVEGRNISFEYRWAADKLAVTASVDKAFSRNGWPRLRKSEGPRVLMRAPSCS